MLNNVELHQMYKEAQYTLENGDAIGASIYGLVKRAEEGDPAAQALIGAAEQGADAEAQAEAIPEAAPEGDGSQPGTIGPNGMMVCPACGTQMTPTLDLLCPACGTDVSQVIAEGMPEQPPMPGATGNPDEEITGVAEQVKQSAMQNPEILQQLIATYKHIL